MFGAMGDGVHNDAPAINSCLAKYGKVYFDAKTYIIGQSAPVSDSDLYYYNTIGFNSSDVSFIGKGIGQTILKFADNNQLIISSSINSTRMLSSKWNVNCNNTTIKGITFDGNYENNKNNGTIHAIIITGLNTNISDCEFINFGVGNHGIDECFQMFLTVADNTSQQDTGSVIVQNNIFRSPGKKTGMEPKTHVPENTFIGIAGNSSYYLSDVKILDNKFIDCNFDVYNQQSAVYGITLAYTSQSIISNNTFSNFDGICYYVNSWKNTNVLITNNTASNVGMFVHLACESMPNINQISYNEKYTISNNKIELMRKPYFWRLGEEPLIPSVISYNFDTSLNRNINYPFREILIKNNVIKLGEFSYNKTHFLSVSFNRIGQNIDEEFIFKDNMLDAPKKKDNSSTKKIVMFSVVGVFILIIILILTLK